MALTTLNAANTNPHIVSHYGAASNVAATIGLNVPGFANVLMDEFTNLAHPHADPKYMAAYAAKPIAAGLAALNEVRPSSPINTNLADARLPGVIGAGDDQLSHGVNIDTTGSSKIRTF